VLQKARELDQGESDISKQESKISDNRLLRGMQESKFVENEFTRNQGIEVREKIDLAGK
jgi:hypothetical protein